MIHPSVRKHIGKAPVGTDQEASGSIIAEVKQEYGQVTAPVVQHTQTIAMEVEQVEFSIF